MYQDLLFLIYMKHNVFRATPPIIRSLPKTALAAPGFSYVEGCWMCGWWMLSGTDVPDNVHRLERPTTGTLRAPLGL